MPQEQVPQEQEFTVTVQKAVFVPELAAIREFVQELKAEFAAHPDRAQMFTDDPRGFLGDRGMSSDLQREWLTELGVGGGDFMCSVLSCAATEGCLVTEITLPDLIPI